MEWHKRVELLDPLLVEAKQKRTALMHALHAKERVEQGEKSTQGAPFTEAEEEDLKYEHNLWQRVESRGTDMRKVLEEIEDLERQRGVSQ